MGSTETMRIPSSSGEVVTCFYDANSVQLRRSGDVLRYQSTQGLGSDNGEHGSRQGARDAVQLGAATHCDEGGESGKNAGNRQICAAQRGHGKVSLAALKAG
jgi:hypothetical protein